MVLRAAAVPYGSQRCSSSDKYYSADQNVTSHHIHMYVRAHIYYQDNQCYFCIKKK
jgi:hypothetical protein